MRNDQGMTPKEAALYEAITAIQADYYGRTNALERSCRTEAGNHSEAFEAQVRRQMAKIHDRLLRQFEASFDGDSGMVELS